MISTIYSKLTLTLLLALVCTAAAEDLAKPYQVSTTLTAIDPAKVLAGRTLTFNTAPKSDIQWVQASPICISLKDGGMIQISCSTGEVTMTGNPKLSDATKQFWKGLADTFPSVAAEMLASARKAEVPVTTARNQMIISALDQGLKAAVALQFNLDAQARAFASDPKVMEVIMDNTQKVLSWQRQMIEVSGIIKAEQTPAKGTP